MMMRSSSSGFTLLEVMVALCIVAVALVTLLGTHMMSLDLARKHRDQTLVSLFAREKIEEAMTVSFDALESDSGDFEPAYPDYKWEMEVEKAETDNLKKVKITIKSPDGDFVLETMIAGKSAK